MNSLPVIWRELLMQSRGRSGHRMRLMTALIALACMGWMMLFSASQAAPASQGRALFDALSTYGLVFSLLAGVLSTADSISFEKREGTVGLLFLTDLKGVDVVLGKLAASSLTSFYSLLGILPMLGFGLLLGGVGGGEMLRMSLLLICCMVFSLSAGLLASTLATHERAAGVFAFLIVLTLTGGPFLLANIYAAATDTRLVNLERDFLWPSPVYAADLARGGAAGVFKDSELRLSLSFMLLLSLLQILLAGMLLPRVWMELPSTSRIRRAADRLKAWLRGSVEARGGYRTLALEQGPYSWLACRDHRKALHSWLVVALMAGLLAACWMASADLFWEPVVTASVLFVGIGVIKFWTVSESCNALVDDRRSGALELILVTPLPVAEIARGHWLAWRRIFGRPALVILTATAVFATAALANAQISESASWIIGLYVAGIVVAGVDIWAIRWTGMCHALRWKVTNRAAGWTIGQLLVLPWMMVAWWLVLRMLWTTYISGGGADLGQGEILLSWVVASLACDLHFGLSARRKFLATFRSIAANEPPPVNEAAAHATIGAGRRRLRLRFALPLAFAGLILLWAAISYQLNAWRLKGAISRAKVDIPAPGLDAARDWNAKGRSLYPLDPKSAEPRGPLPPALNAAVNFDAAARMLDNPIQGGLGSWYYSSMRRGWDFAARYDPAAFAKLIEPRRPVLDLFKAALQCPAMFREVHTGLEPKVWDVWRGNQEAGILLRTAAYHAIRQGDADEACDLVLAHLRFVRSYLEVPSFSAESRGRWLLSGALGSLGAVLGEHKLTKAHLDRIAAELELLEPPGLMPRRIAATVANALEASRADIDDQLAHLGATQPAERFALEAALRYWICSGGRDRTLTATLNAAPRIIQAWIKSPISAAESKWELDAAAPGILRRWSFNQDTIADGLATGVARLASLEAARTGVEIERHRLRTGRLPETLAQLPAEFLKDHAKDPCTGEGLKYRIERDCYIVYSVGLDKRDEGGKPGVGNIRNGDFALRVGDMPVAGMDRPPVPRSGMRGR